MRIFVTGASGFIGQHTVPLLVKDKHELLVLLRTGAVGGPRYPRVRTVRGDLKDLSRAKKTIIRFDPQACLHLAWEGIPDYSYRYSKRNLDYSLALINMLVNETRCRKIISSGSSWEYGKTSGVCKETDRPVITSFFSWAKNTIYNYGSFICAQQRRDFIWLRIFFAFGPGQKGHSLIPMLYNSLKNRRSPYIKNPRNEQDFIYVQDVAAALRLAVKKPISSGIYNIGRGGPIRVSDVCRMVERRISEKLLSENPAVLKAPAISRVHVWADTAKFKRATGWRPRVTVEEGIKNHIAFLEAI